MKIVTTRLIEAALIIFLMLVMGLSVNYLLQKVYTDVKTISKEVVLSTIKESYIQSKPAIEWKSGVAINKKIRVGENLNIKYEAIINKQCPADLRSFLLKLNPLQALQLGA
jgi:hypothetical protein